MGENNCVKRSIMLICIRVVVLVNIPMVVNFLHDRLKTCEIILSMKFICVKLIDYCC